MYERLKIRLQNTLTGKKEDFAPANPDRVRIYSCGPTVYGYTHVGNARAALSLDLIARTLEFAGYQVEVARNFTDVDDKIIAVAEREGKEASAVAEFFKQAYIQDLLALKTRLPEHCPEVTKSMPEIIQFIEGLVQKNAAYVVKTTVGQDVYFKVESFKAYGKLSRRKLDEMLKGVRIDVEEGKKHPADFALWKAAKPAEPSWESPWGSGRPGWHIECSAMIHSLFEEPIDIHCGGIDLVFPHHENEIAQSEALTGKPLARYWLHNGLLELGQEKMSKSLGNIVSTKDFIAQRHPETLRLLFLQQHYRSPLDFSQENIERAESLLERLYHVKQLMLEASPQATIEAPGELAAIADQMSLALCDDFNSAKALGVLLGGIRVCYRERKNELWSLLRKPFQILETVFGITTENPQTFIVTMREKRLKRWNLTTAECERVEELLKERLRLRSEKAFAMADEIRKNLESEGYLIMDGPDGTDWAKREI